MRSAVQSDEVLAAEFVPLRSDEAIGQRADLSPDDAVEFLARTILHLNDITFRRILHVDGRGNGGDGTTSIGLWQFGGLHLGQRDLRRRLRV